MANQQPNQFSFKDRHLAIDYSTTGIQGLPSLAYHEGRQTLNFQGDQIRVEETEVGTLVSVTIKATVDVGSTSFTVVIPPIQVSNMGVEVSFETVGIKAAHKTPLVQPATGARTTYETHHLQGTARIVDFLAAKPGASAGSAQ